MSYSERNIWRPVPSNSGCYFLCSILAATVGISFWSVDAWIRTHESLYFWNESWLLNYLCAMSSGIILGRLLAVPQGVWVCVFGILLDCTLRTRCVPPHFEMSGSLFILDFLWNHVCFMSCSSWVSQFVDRIKLSNSIGTNLEVGTFHIFLQILVFGTTLRRLWLHVLLMCFWEPSNFCTLDVGCDALSFKAGD